MKIADIRVRVFRYTSKQVRDSDGHTHPGDPHEARQALLTIGGGPGNLTLCAVQKNGRWYERGLLHPFLDYDEVPEYLNSRADPMDQQGFVHLSQRPGLGEDINFDYIDANLV